MVTIPPAYAEDPNPSNNNIGKNFFIILQTIFLSVFSKMFYEEKINFYIGVDKSVKFC